MSARKLSVACLIAILAGAAPASAQEPVPGAAAPAPPLDVVNLRFVDNVQLDAAARQPGVPIKARFTDVVRDPATVGRLQLVDINGVLAVGDGSGVAPGATLGPRQLLRYNGRVVWSAVSLQQPDQGINRREELNSPLVSDFGSASARVPTGTVVRARGDVNGAIATALKLFDRKDEEKEKKDEAAADKKSQDQGAAADSRRAAVQAASPAKSNDLAANFRPSQPQIVTQAADPVAGTTTEGCPARVDLANEQVTIQSRLTQNGVPQGACSDTNETFQLKRSYTGCADAVDRSAGEARPTYRRYWVDAGGSTQYVDADCQPDAEQSFALTEDKGSCTVDVNLTTNTASVRTQLVYQNRSNQRIVVDDCRVAPGAATAPIATTATGCSLRHDFAAGTSFEQKKKTYDLDGLTYTVQACSDTGVSYAHTRVTNVCNPVVDFNVNKAFPQYRTRITVDGVDQYINDCTPDQALAQDLQKTGQGCETTFFHNISAGQSFGSARWYHTLSGSPTYVTVCQQDDAVTYAHQNETTGYQHDDTAKISKPLTRIHFMSPVGDIEVSGPQVREGAPEIAYVLDRQEVQTTGEVSYTGCDKYQERANMNIYRRADATEYSEVASPASPLGPTNACTISTSWGVLSLGTPALRPGCSGDDDCGCEASINTWRQDQSCTYRGTMQRNRDDGTVVSTGQNDRSYPQTACRHWADTSNMCPTPNPGGSVTNTWNVENGWF